MRVVLSAIGSMDDVEPFLALSAELQSAGHQAVLALSPQFGPHVTAMGFPFVPIGPLLDLDTTGDMLSGGQDGDESLRRMQRYIDATRNAHGTIYRDLLNACRTADILIGSPYQFACRMVHDFAGIPYVSLHLAIANPLALNATRELATFLVNDCRTNAGLARVIDPFGVDGTSDQLALYTFSPHILPRPTYWPEHYRAIGFLPQNGSHEYDPSPELNSFCAAASPLVLISLSRALQAAPAQVQIIINEAAKLSGLRMVVLGVPSPRAAQELPESIFFAADHDRSWLFSKASLIVHDGGAAVSANTFFAGIPAVIILPPGQSSAWAELSRSKGCTKNALPLAHLNARRLAAAIKDTLGSGAPMAAAAFGEDIRAEKAAEIACRLIEQSALQGHQQNNASGDLHPGEHQLARLRREPPLTRKERNGHLPLSHSQQRLWFIHQLQPESPLYNMPFGYRIEGELDREFLRRSINEILRRHEVLRSTFRCEHGQPVIEINEREVLIKEFDLRGLPLEDREVEATRQFQFEARTPFDLADGPILRVNLWQLAERDHILLINAHHIIADGWSTEIFLRELTDLYASFSLGQPSTLKELPIQYLDFSIWQRDWLQGEVLEEQLNYWREQLKEVQPLALPTDYPRSAALSQRGAKLSVALSPELVFRLKRLSRNEQVTLFMTLLAAFQLLFARYARQDDVAVGTAIANRKFKDLENLIGMFVNTLVLRTNLSGNPTFKELLQRVKRVALEAYAHQDIPFEKLVEVLGRNSDRSRTPLFQVMFVLQNAPSGKLQLGTLKLSPVRVETHTSKFELLLSLEDSANGIIGNLEYSTDLFEKSSVSNMWVHLENLLWSISGAGGELQRIGEVPLLTEAEERQLLVEWNRTERFFPSEDGFHRLFEHQVMRTPNSIALICNQECQTYIELNRQANQLGHYLRRLGIRPEMRVGICAERRLEMLAAILGVLKAGAAYVPLDPNYPGDRLRFMLQDSEVALILTQKSLAKLLNGFEDKLVFIDGGTPEIGHESTENVDSGVLSQNIAYLIYTSGSTGRPKGVMIENQNTLSFLHWARGIYKPELLHRVLAATSICFDLSIFELFLPLSCGGSIVLAENILQLAELDETDEISLINTVPSALSELIKAHPLPRSVRIVNLAGEELPSSLAQRLYFCPGVEQVFNLYGPSEDTTYSTFISLPREQERAVPIGVPISNTQVYILNEHLVPVPPGVPGEICIAGAGLSRGYWSRPELTAEKFVPNPFAPTGGERMYRTGDLGKHRSDGTIEFLGRADQQVKVRGYRIELGEIEAVLREQDDVEQAAVVVHKDAHGNQLLAGYVVGPQSVRLEDARLRQQLQRKLPEYMVPGVFMQLDQLPLNSSGKIDRKALPAPNTENAGLKRDYVSPGTELEIALSRIWGDVLGMERVGINSDFFEIGGHSLLAVRLVNDMNMAGFQCSLRDLHDHPTIAGLVRHIELSNPDDKASRHPENATFPLLPVQMRQMPAPDHVVTRLVPVFIKITEPINDANFIQALELWYKQDIFRLRFKKDYEEWRQFYDRQSLGSYAPIQEFTLNGVQDEDNLVQEVVRICRTLISSINILTGPGIQIALLRTQRVITHMIWLIDHLLVDNSSLSMLLNSMRNIYRQVVQHKRVVIAPDTVIAEWAEYLSRQSRDERILREYPFWEAHFGRKKDCVPVQCYSGNGSGRVEADHVGDSLNRDETEQLFARLSIQRLSFEEICLGNFLWAVRTSLSEQEPLLAMANSGREARVDGIDLSRGLGSFALFYPALFNLGTSQSYDIFIRDVVQQHRSYSGRKETYSILRFLNRDTGKQLQEKEDWAPSIIFNCLGMGASAQGKTEEVFRLSTAWRKVANAFAKDQDQSGTHYRAGFPRRGITFVGSDDSIQISLLFYKDDGQREQLFDLVKQTKKGLLGMIS